MSVDIELGHVKYSSFKKSSLIKDEYECLYIHCYIKNETLSLYITVITIIISPNNYGQCMIRLVINSSQASHRQATTHDIESRNQPLEKPHTPT